MGGDTPSAVKSLNKKTTEGSFKHYREDMSQMPSFRSRERSIKKLQVS